MSDLVETQDQFSCIALNTYNVFINTVLFQKHAIAPFVIHVLESTYGNKNPALLLKLLVHILYMRRQARKPDFCLGENKGADQLCSNCTADQCLCFHYTDSAIPLLLKSKFKLLTIFSDCTGRFVSDPVGNPEDRFLASRLIRDMTTQIKTKLYMEKPAHKPDHSIIALSF